MLNDKKVFDVANAGQTTPPANSRPIIVTHGGMLEDPMMAKPSSESAAKKADLNTKADVTRDDLAAKGEDPKSASPSNRVKIFPINDQESTKKQANKLEGEVSKPEVSPVSDTETAVISAVVNQAGSVRDEKDQANDNDTKRKAEIEQAITDKKYFLNIGESHSVRSFNRAIILLLILLLLSLVGFNFALDANLLDIDIQPVTNLIK